ncbi:hypothetical protein BJY16_002618 [Actinoplanes octamycinicus]|uniref:Uncharacterized protein n=1 Tax=Actinoplanes octamycinicus TaxID=135948 RepID=A0A7W7M6U6_9ACTN|nr:hypothetical protein [Actinoplanes octamycinicus]MBB4739159.1 hypothetical protein [Actinoplanes octamycinicus]
MDGLRSASTTAGLVRPSFLDTGWHQEKHMRATNNREPGDEAVPPERDGDPSRPAEPGDPATGDIRTRWEDGTAVPYWVAPDDVPVED